MKISITAILFLATCASVFALALEMPYTIIYREKAPIHCGAPVFTHQVDGNSDGSYAGLLYQSTHCSSGGRGSKSLYYSACAAVSWKPDGHLEYIDIIWTSLPHATGVPARAVGDCLGVSP